MRFSNTSKHADNDAIPGWNSGTNQLQSNPSGCVFPGDGEMSRLMRAFQWEKTPLGPVESWPQSLRTSVGICLASAFPIVLYWGPEYVVLYNDAYSQILGSKHPWALGRSCRECWAEIWNTIGPMLDGVLNTGKATRSDDMLLTLHRFGYSEECYFSFSFSPVQVETGAVGGVFTSVIETTEKVIGERRLRTLRDLAARTGVAKSEHDAWQIVTCTLAENNRDVPFAVLCEASGNSLRIVGSPGISPTHALCEELCRPGSELFQKAMQVSTSGQPAELPDLSAITKALPRGPLDASSLTAMLLPVAALGQGSSGVLLAATNSAKALDESYRTFFGLLTRQIAAGIAGARSCEQERKRAEALAELDRARTLRREAAERESRLCATAEKERGRLQEMLAQAPAAIGLLSGPEHRWSYVNSECIRLTGRKSPEDFVGKTIVESLPELRAQVVAELLNGVYSTGKPYFGHEVKAILNRSAQGLPHKSYWDFVFQPIRDAEDNIEGILVHAVEVTDRVLAGRAIEESEKKYRDFAETANIGLHWVGPDGSVLWANKAELDLLGYTAEEYIGHHIGEFFVDAPVIENIFSLLSRGERLREHEARLRAKDGSIRQVIIDSSALFENEKFVHTRCFTRDVTEHKLAEQALRESEQRLRLAHQAAGIGTFELNLQTNVNCWTPELEAMYGLAPGTFEGTQEHWQRLLHPDDRCAALRQMAIAVQTGAPVQAEWRVIWPNGTIHWLLGRWQVFNNEAGTPVRMTGINIDVTERKAAEEARRRLAAIVESSNDAIVGKDLNGIITSWNRQAESLFGYKEAEMIGRSILTIIPPELQRDEDMILSKIRSGQKIDHFETVRITKSGERVEVSLSISPVRDGNAKIVGAAKIARDIRESKNIERTLRTTEKLAAAGRLAATVAHEINNPLEAVTNLIYLAKRDLPNPDKVAAYLTSAQRELGCVAHITRQTLGFYRDTSSPVRFNVTQGLDDLLGLYDRRLDARGIRVIKEYDQGAEITVLAGEIRQAFSNLLTNAMDAMSAGGTLKIRVRKTHQCRDDHSPGVRITIADSGSGIATEHKRKIFEPFFTTKADVGTGLGLWITRGIVEKHGGAIQVKSRVGTRHGTCFSIFLPAQSGSALQGLAQRDAVTGAA
jgi:PAS domain S-box-containing protein